MKILLSLLLVLSINADMYAQQSEVMMAEKAYQQGKLKKAKEAIDSAFANPALQETPETWLLRGKIYAAIYSSKKGKFLKLSTNAENESYSAFQKYKTLIPDNASTQLADSLLLQLGATSLQYGYLWNEEGDFLMSFENFHLSVKCADLAGKIDSLAHFNCAIALGQANEIDRAIKWYEKCIKIEFRPRQACRYIVRTLRAAGRNAEADIRKVECQETFPDDIDELIEKINVNIAEGELKSAKQNIKKALLIDPEHVLLLFTLASVEDHLGDNNAAERLYLKVVELDPEFFDVNYNLGVLYFNKGADIINTSNRLDYDKKRHKAAKKEAKSVFSTSEFYLETAAKLRPSNRETLVALKNLYQVTEDKKKLKRVNNLLN